MASERPGGWRKGDRNVRLAGDELKKEVKEKPLCVATFPPSRLWASAAPFQTALVPNTKSQRVE